MLRLLVSASIGLTAGFAVVAGLLSREWGWSEYASDELYVVYGYIADGYRNQNIYITDVHDNLKTEQIISADKWITAVGCSPDGRVLAFLTDVQQLYVITSSGLVYMHKVDRLYNDIEVMNNQDVKLYLEQVYAIQVNAVGSDSISATHSGIWLASEQIYGDSYDISNAYLKDIQSGHSVRVRRGISFFPPISPDGTQIALSVNSGIGWRITIADYLTGESVRSFSTRNDIYMYPVCFLTFRPEMLIDQAND